MSLPLFSFEVTVSAGTARQDKTEIFVKHGMIRDEAGDVAEFLHYLGAPPADPGYERSAFGQIFNRPRRGEPRFLRQVIRQTTTAGIPPPLFGGWLDIAENAGERSCWNLESFLRHQRFPSPASRLLRNCRRFPFDLYRRDVPLLEHGEFALIEADNWIPASRLWGMFASSRFWQRHLSRYVEGAIEMLQADIRRAAGHANVRIQPPCANPFNVRMVETYWEFYSPNPLATVRQLQPLLESFSASNVQPQDYPIEVTHENLQNSRRVALQTRVGETLKIYAKTNRRIRFEITHRLSSRSPYRLPEGGHTFAGIEGVLGLLARLAAIAGERVNEVIRHFRLQASTPENQNSVLAFICAVQSCCDDEDTSLDLIQILANNGSLVVGRGIPLRSVFREELERLVAARILLRSNRRYSVAPQYCEALSQLHDAGLHFLLGPRRRRRDR